MRRIQGEGRRGLEGGHPSNGAFCACVLSPER